MSNSPTVQDLITQVPDDDAEAEPTSEAPRSAFGKFCSCIFNGRQELRGQKLAAVVPAPEVQTTVSETRGHHPVGATAARSGDVRPAQVQIPSSGSCRRHTPPSREWIWGPEKKDPPQLGPQAGRNIGRKTLVLDLDETLVHSSFRVTKLADIIVPVDLEGDTHNVYVRKRPGVDEFLLRVAEMYEVVVYTASLSKYANPLLDELDKFNTISFRLFREACTRHSSGYMKDLSRLGRDLKCVIIIDNSPICYALQPHNAIPVKMWKDDPADRELWDLIPILYALADVENIPAVLEQIVWSADDGEEEG